MHPFSAFLKSKQLGFILPFSLFFFQNQAVGLASNVVPTISISVSPSNSICAGTSVTFTATTTNGGSQPVFLWKKNGYTVSSSGLTFTSTQLSDGDEISCQLFSNDPMAMPTTASSNLIKMTVRFVGPPLVTVERTAFNPCGDGLVTFKATVEQGGSTPIFQWTRNNLPVGSNSPIYSAADFQNGDFVRCQVTSNDGCVQPSMGISYPNVLEFSHFVQPYAFLVADKTMPICAGTTVNYTVDSEYLGDAPSFVWKKNGVVVAGNQTAHLTDATLVDGDKIECEVTSSLSCVLPKKFTAEQTVSVFSTPPVASVSMYSPSPAACESENLELVFLINDIQKGGDAPAFQWRKNGISIPMATEPTFSATDLKPGDVISVAMTSSLTCAMPQTAISTEITISQLLTTPSVEVEKFQSNTCPGSPVVFSAKAFFGGSAPSFQWKRNGQAVGSNSPFYAATDFQNGDVVFCELTSNSTCASSPTARSFDFTVNISSEIMPAALIYPTIGLPICADEMASFSAYGSNWGDSPTFSWTQNGAAVGTNSPNYSATGGWTDGEQIRCQVTSSLSCAVPQSVLSNIVPMDVFDAPPVPYFYVHPAASTAICENDQTSVLWYADYVQTQGGEQHFQWKKNGQNVWFDSPNFYDFQPHVGDVITCELTSSHGCSQPNPLVSDPISYTQAVFQPSVYIDLAENYLCVGTEMTFHAQPNRGGSAPVFQWKINGQNAGSNSATFKTTALQPNDVVTCEMTSNDPCVSPTMAVSNPIYPTIYLELPLTASAYALNNYPICSDGAASFSLYGNNFGSNPTFQWKRNGQNAGFNLNGFIGTNWADGEQVTCVVTSSLTCAVPQSVETQPVAVDVFDVPPVPSVTIYPPYGIAICEGTGQYLGFQGTSFQNQGDAPTFLWRKNGQVVNGATSSYVFDYDPHVGDVFRLEMTSSLTCAQPQTAISNEITVEQAMNLPSVYISTPDNGACIGSPVFFEASPYLGGSAPVFQWKINGQNVAGANGKTFTTTALQNGDFVSCEMISNDICASHQPVVSYPIYLTIYTELQPTATINFYQAQVACPTDSLIFQVYGPNFGKNPSFLWKKNGSPFGLDSSIVKAANWTNGDVVTVEVTSSLTCAVPQTVVSQSVVVQVFDSPPVPSLSISAPYGHEVCNGVTNYLYFYLDGYQNGGSQPFFQWKKNGITSVADQSYFTDYNPHVGDVITCEMTSNLTCAEPKTVISNVIEIVQATFTPTIYINQTQNEPCAGAPTTFQAGTNLGGQNPSFQWKINGQNAGSNASTFTTTALQNGDIVTCQLISDDPCASHLPVLSNEIYMTLYTELAASATLYLYEQMPICSQNELNFQVYGSNLGSAPIFHWKRNGQSVGSGEPTYVGTNWSDGELVTCEIESSFLCAVPQPVVTAPVVVDVYDVPPVPSVSIAPIYGTQVCDAEPSYAGFFVNGIANAGNGFTYQWKKNGQNVGYQSSEYYEYGPHVGDQFWVEMTSALACAEPKTAISNKITMEQLQFQPTVSVGTSMNGICIGEPMTFYVSTTYGGSAATFQWKRNGQNLMGETGSTLMISTLQNGDQISCEMISNDPCATHLPVVSPPFEVVIYTELPFSITFNHSGPAEICPTDGRYFTVDGYNLGNAPTYQWFKNGQPVGDNVYIFYGDNWTDGDAIYCQVTSALSCAVPQTISTETFLVDVYQQPLVASVEIGTLAGPQICDGQGVYFYVKSSENLGPSPFFVWKKNGQTYSYDFLYFYDYQPQVGDVITCEAYSNLSCVASNPTFSNAIVERDCCDFDPEISQKITGCYPFSAQLTAAVGDVYAYDYVWKKDGHALPNTNWFQIDVTQAGSYTVEAARKNHTDCSHVSQPFLLQIPPLITIDPQPTVCENAGPTVLHFGHPSGGFYVGAGVLSDSLTFDPSLVSGTGPHFLSYIYEPSGVCKLDSFEVKIASKPIVSLAPFPSVYNISPSFSLTNGLPAGGIYSGPGVSNGVFDPWTAGIGTHVITFIATNADGCTASATASIQVLEGLHCPVDRVRNLNGTCKITVPNVLGEVTVAPAFSIISKTQSPAAGTQIALSHGQTASLSVTVVLSNGQTRVCNSIMTAHDVTAPSILNCQTNPIQATMNTACKIGIPNLLPILSVNEACSMPLSKAQSPVGGTILTVTNGQLIPITIVVTDAAGNTATCVRMLKAVDLMPPTIKKCPPAQTVPLTADCKLVVPNLIPAFDAVDCSGPVVKTQIPAAGTQIASDDQQIHFVQMKATDALGKTKVCSVKLTGVGAGCLEGTGGEASFDGNSSNNFNQSANPNDKNVIEQKLDLQAMPNPFGDELTIAFDLHEATKTRLILTDLTGRFLFFEKEKSSEAGRQTWTWNTEDLPEGAYLVGLKVENEGWRYRKVMLVRK